MGVERLLDLFEKYNGEEIQDYNMDLYIATVGEDANLCATKLIMALRDEGLLCEKDICERSLKAQFKYADKKKARFVLTIGDDEVKNNCAKLKDMETGEEQEVKLTAEEIFNKIFE